MSEIAISPGKSDTLIECKDGERIAASDLRGSPALLLFSHNAWDPSRRYQLDIVNRALERIGNGDRIFDLSERGDWIQAETAGHESLAFRLLEVQADSEGARVFGVEGEGAIVLDSQGVERWRFKGSMPLTDNLLEAMGVPNRRRGVSRREFLSTTVAAIVAISFMSCVTKASDYPSAPIQTGDRTIHLNINGADRAVTVDPRVTLLDALRERIGLTGTKKGCDHGQCGACTVHMDGRRVNACLILAVQAEGAKIVTVEGLARGDALHPVQEAFIKHDGFQCGYCTSGQVMSAVACIHEGHAGSDEEIKEWMSGNICRCGAYPGICEAIKEARGRMR